MWPNPQVPADLVTFTEEILNEKLHFLCSVVRVHIDGTLKSILPNHSRKFVWQSWQIFEGADALKWFSRQTLE